MSDKRRIEWILGALVWDGYGYWLPDKCVKERKGDDVHTPEPTLEELRSWIDEQIKEQQ